MDQTAFLLAFQAALKDNIVMQSLSTIFMSKLDELADKVAIKLDARLKSMDAEMKSKDTRITNLEK